MANRYLNEIRLIFVAMFALLALLFTIATASRPGKLCRFVSEPLPDGSRLTFLYPAYMSPKPAVVGLTSGLTSIYIGFNHSPTAGSYVDRLFSRVIAKPRKRDDSMEAIVLIPAHGSSQENRYSEELRDGRNVEVREVLFRTVNGARYQVNYGYPEKDTAEYKRYERPILRSLRVLDSSEELPKP
jgi:hypothetical protein